MLQVMRSRAVKDAGAATANTHPQQLLTPLALASSLLLGSAIFDQPAAYAAIAAAPAEHEALLATPTAALQQQLPAAPPLAIVSPFQMVGSAAAAEGMPTETGPAGEDDDNAALIFVGLVFAVVVFTSTRSDGSSSSSSSNSAIDRDALERSDRFPWSGFNRFGDDFDWIDDD
jgi:hypothetical protein